MFSKISFVIKFCGNPVGFGAAWGTRSHRQRWGRALWGSLQSWMSPVFPSQVHAWEPSSAQSSV